MLSIIDPASLLMVCIHTLLIVPAFLGLVTYSMLSTSAWVATQLVSYLPCNTSTHATCMRLFPPFMSCDLSGLVLCHRPLDLCFPWVSNERCPRGCCALPRLPSSHVAKRQQIIQREQYYCTLGSLMLISAPTFCISSDGCLHVLACHIPTENAMLQVCMFGCGVEYDQSRHNFACAHAGASVAVTCAMAHPPLRPWGRASRMIGMTRACAWQMPRF